MNTSPEWARSGLDYTARLGGLLLRVTSRGNTSDDPATSRWVCSWSVERPHDATVGDHMVAEGTASKETAKPAGRAGVVALATHVRHLAERQAEAAAWHHLINDPVLGLYLTGAAEDIQAAYADVWPAAKEGST